MTDNSEKQEMKTLTGEQVPEWVKCFGTAMFEKVEVYWGGQLIERLLFCKDCHKQYPHCFESSCPYCSFEIEKTSNKKDTKQRNKRK